MKLLFLVLFSTLFIYAQPETGKKIKSFPGFPILTNPKSIIKSSEVKPEKFNPFSKNDSLKNSEPLFTLSSNLFHFEKKPSFVIGENKNNILNPKDAFINPNIDVLDKLNGKLPKSVSEDFKAIRGNQDLGNFKLDSKFVNIRYRDFGEVDGDQIRVFLNGHVIYENIFLDGYFKGIEISLEKGFNKIDFEALNQGTTGPNTAEFQVFDDNEKLVSSNQWNLVTGFKASIMIIKE